MKPMHAGLALVMLVHAAGAQSSGDRLAIDAFRDTLSRAGTAEALASLHPPGPAATGDPARQDVAQLRYGFLLLRSADLTADFAALQEAAGVFGSVSGRHPDWPYAWFGRSLAELGQVEGQLPAVLAAQRFFGKDPLKGAKADLGRSLQADSLFAPQVAPFILASVRQRVSTRLEVSLAVVRKAASTAAARQPALLLARGMIERATGDLDSARAAIAEYRRLLPDDPTGMLEAATELLEGGRQQGIALWYEGLNRSDALALALYRDDLAILMPDSTLEAFDRATTPAAREAVVRRFWNSSDPDGLPTGDDRLRDHYIRLGYARGHFIPPVHRDLIEPTPLLTSAVDDRGLIYVRHGPPTVRTYTDLPGVAKNETWWYNGDHGDTLLFNFLVREPDPGYRLVPSFFDIIALSGQARVAGVSQKELSAADSARHPFQIFGAGLVAQTVQDLFSARYAIPVYARMMDEGLKSAPALQTEERRLGEHSIGERESWRLSYELSLGASVDLVAVRGTASQPQLQVAFAVPADNIIPTRLTRGYMYPIRMRLGVADRDGSTITAIDTTRMFYAAERIPSGRFLLGRLPLALPAGSYSVSVALESGVSGVVVPRQQVVLRDLDRQALSLSDLALGSPTVRLSLPGLAGESIWINPLQTYTKKSTLSLYAEVGGLTRGATYHTDIEVVRVSSSGAVEAKGGQALKFGFESRRSGTVDPLARDIIVSRLSPGNYALIVTVSTPDGQRESRERRFTVTKE